MEEHIMENIEEQENLAKTTGPNSIEVWIAVCSGLGVVFSFALDNWAFFPIGIALGAVIGAGLDECIKKKDED